MPRLAGALPPAGPAPGGPLTVSRHEDRPDTEAGRCLVQTTTDAAGTAAARYVPATFAGVADAVRDVIATVY